MVPFTSRVLNGRGDVAVSDRSAPGDHAAEGGVVLVFRLVSMGLEADV